MNKIITLFLLFYKFAVVTGLRMEFGWFCLATAYFRLFLKILFFN